jgi:pilus assembly protein FimV
LKHRPTRAARFALNGVALAAACLWATQAWALGLGRLTVSSALGETLRAEIEITSITPEEASSLQLRIAPAEAFRAAGVDYNAALPSASVQLVRRPDGRQVVRISGERAVLEPFVDVIIEASWSSGRLVREYTMLFDPPGPRLAQQAPATPSTAPSMAPAPVPAGTGTPAMPSPAPSPLAGAPAPARPTPRPAATPMEPPRPPVATAAPAAGTGPDEVRVRPGDSLSRIASRSQRPGISLDQMLVSLFRGNPQAFSGDNMNRLKSGAVLSVPSAEQAGTISAAEARELITAQSADFAAYRQRLATGTTTEADAAAGRQAGGQVQTQVDDRKQAAAPTPDRLKLSQGGLKASAPEARASTEAQKRDEAARLAELARNVDELKKLQGATATATPKPATAATPPAAAPATTTPPAAAPALPAPTVVAAAPAPAPAPASAPEPAVAAAPAPASAPAPAAATTPPAPVTPTAASEPGLMDSLLDNSLLLPGAGVLVALLAGLGLYRLRSRRKPAGETSFLESRLQPDSFFGASGGQRIDTRDAPATGNSSMSYSLSQLDAIGDVDPVAEADVYLAYGRDLQAEEILKEAMRATPERMAIRSKLLEVYAKRRDIKAFELLATQMFNLTRGEGEDWKKAQELGLSIDPENILYAPGGQPEEVRAAGGVMMPDALGASTQPYTAPVQPPAFQPAVDATLDSRMDSRLDDAGPSSAMDLDLDLEFPGGSVVNPAPAAPTIPITETTQPFTTAAQMGGDSTLDFTLETAGDPKTMPVQRNAPPPPADDGLDFDLGVLAEEPPTVAVQPKAPSASDSSFDFGDFSIGGEPLTPPTEGGEAGGDDANDPLSRKLELAEEFRQIGDLEGARDLLEEVVAKGAGPLQAKAQGMLDKLA